MKRLKKLGATLLVGILTFSLVACATKGSDATNNNSSDNTADIITMAKDKLS